MKAPTFTTSAPPCTGWSPGVCLPRPSPPTACPWTPRLSRPSSSRSRKALPRPRPNCDLIQQCLEFHPNKRPERMSEIQGTLDHLVDMVVTAPEDRLEAMEW